MEFSGLRGLCIFVPMLYAISTAAQVQKDHFVPFKFGLNDKFSLAADEEIEQEVEDIVEIQQGINDENLREINYWNAAYPSYRWHQILMEISRSHKGHKNGGRVVILHLSIYDALVETWKHKKANDQQAPCQLPVRLPRYYRFFFLRMKSCFMNWRGNAPNHASKEGFISAPTMKSGWK